MLKRRSIQSEFADERFAKDVRDLDTLIDACIDRELCDDEAAELFSRLWHDPDRLDRLMTERALADEIRMSQEWAPASLTARIRHRLGLRPQIHEISNRTRFFHRMRRVGLAAAAAIALSAGIWLRGGESTVIQPGVAESSPIQFQSLTDLISEEESSVFAPLNQVLRVEVETDRGSYPNISTIRVYSPRGRMKQRGNLNRTDWPIEFGPTWRIPAKAQLEPPTSTPVELEDLGFPLDGEPATGPMSFV